MQPGAGGAVFAVSYPPMRGQGVVKRPGYGAVSTKWTAIKPGSGREKYLRQQALGYEDYVREGDTPLRWLGAGAAAHGLEGEASLGTLEAMLMGVHPAVVSGKREPEPADPSDLDSVQRLAPDAWSDDDLTAPGRRRLSAMAKRATMNREERQRPAPNDALETTFAPPKSVSVMWGLAGEKRAAQIEAIHDAAVDEAFGVLERHCAWSRKGKRPAHGWIRTRGLIAQAARHTTNRANEMHLHTHVAVANMVECVDGQWRTPDSEFLFQWRPAATSAYARALYAGLDELGIAMTEPNRHGVREVAAIPESLAVRFSTRTQVILDQAEELAMARAARGDKNPVGAKERAIISDNTRADKQISESLPEKRERWAAIASAELAGEAARRDERLRGARATRIEVLAAGLAASAVAAAHHGQLDADWAGAPEMIDPDSAAGAALSAVAAVAERAEAEGWDAVRLRVEVADAVLDSVLGAGVDRERRQALLGVALGAGDPLEHLQSTLVTARRPEPAAPWDPQARKAAAEDAAAWLSAEADSTWDAEQLLRALQRFAPLRVLDETGTARRLTTDDLWALAGEMSKAGLVRRLLTVGVGVNDEARQIVQRPDGARWATTAVLDVERRVDAWWRRIQHEAGVRIDPALVRAACEDEELGEDQAEVLEAICSGDRRGHLIVGAAGTGKTRMLLGLREATRRAGVPMAAMAVSQDAVEVLIDEKDGPGIAGAMNIAEALTAVDSLARALARDPRGERQATQELRAKVDAALPARGYWVIDEAGMADRYHLLGLGRLAQKRGATVVLVGDDEQHGAVKSSSLYADWVRDEDLVRHELGVVRRFEEAWEGPNSKRLRVGDRDAVAELDRRGRLITAGADDAAVAEITRRYVAESLEGFDVVAVAGAHHETDVLNAAIRQRMFPDERAEVAITWTDEHGNHRRPFSVGDRVITLRNDRRIQTSDRRRIVNGDRWEVEGLTAADGLLLRSVGRKQRTAQIPRAWLDRRHEETGRPLIDHGWATNSHKVQGRTVERSLTWLTRSLDKRGFYVAMTRGKVGNWAIASDEYGTAAEQAISTLERERTDISAVAHERLARAELARQQQAAQQPPQPVVFDIEAEEPPRPRPPPVEPDGGMDI